MTFFNQDFAIFPGDDRTLRVTTYDTDGVAKKDISSATVIDWLFKWPGGSILKQLASGITITDGPNGVFEITLASGDTSTMTKGIGYHQATMTLGGKHATIMDGRGTIMESLV